MTMFENEARFYVPEMSRAALAAVMASGSGELMPS
jgi:hypothetical protein